MIIFFSSYVNMNISSYVNIFLNSFLVVIKDPDAGKD